MLFFMLNRKNSGIYNLGTGKARSFNDLGNVITSYSIHYTKLYELKSVWKIKILGFT